MQTLSPGQCLLSGHPLHVLLEDSASVLWRLPPALCQQRQQEWAGKLSCAVVPMGLKTHGRLNPSMSSPGSCLTSTY